MIRLRTLLVVTCLVTGTPLLHSAGPNPQAAHPLVGTWTWTLFGGSCNETFQYRANRTLLGSSGQEVVEKNYEVTAAADAQGFYRVLETVIRQNDKQNCSGATPDAAGEQTTRFIQYSPQLDKLLICESASLAACYGPLRRVD